MPAYYPEPDMCTLSHRPVLKAQASLETGLLPDCHIRDLQDIPENGPFPYLALREIFRTGISAATCTGSIYESGLGRHAFTDGYRILSRLGHYIYPCTVAEKGFSG